MSTPSDNNAWGSQPYGDSNAPQSPYDASADSTASAQDPYQVGHSAQGAQDPFGSPAPQSDSSAAPQFGDQNTAAGQDPFNQSAGQNGYGQPSAGEPYGTGSSQDSFGQPSAGQSYGADSSQDAFGQQQASDPYAAPPAQSPYGSQQSASDPYAAPGQQSASDPYTASGQDAFGQRSASDPYAASGQQSASDPYGVAAGQQGTQGWAPTAQNGTPAGAQGEMGPSRLMVGLLGIFLGGFGVHRFLLGYTTIGIIQIVVTVVTCGVGAWWGLIEGIMVLAKTESFNRDAHGRPLAE